MSPSSVKKRRRNSSPCSAASSSDAASTTTPKERLLAILDEYCYTHKLAELHTHLMGMGSADFWVSSVIEQYIPRCVDAGEEDVFYSLDNIMTASSITNPHTGNSEWDRSIMRATLESRLFDGIPGGNFTTYCKKGQNLKDEEVDGIYNQDLVTLLKLEEKNHNGRSLRALVRNWFEFLDSGGNVVSHTDILDAYRGKFDPEFYPRRFIMKDCILKTHPEVLSILLNRVTHRYGKAGVWYMELSVSLSDLTNRKTWKTLLDGVHTSKRSAPPKPRASRKPPKAETSIAEHSTCHAAESTSFSSISHAAFELSSDSEGFLRPVSSINVDRAITPERELLGFSPCGYFSPLSSAFKEDQEEPSSDVVSFAFELSSHPEGSIHPVSSLNVDRAITPETGFNPSLSYGEPSYGFFSPSSATFKEDQEEPSSDVVCLPTTTDIDNLRPSWRKHLNYYEKSPVQTYGFLGALNRNGVIRLPCAANYLQNDTFDITFPPDRSPTNNAYLLLYELGKSSLGAEVTTTSREQMCNQFAKLAERLCDDDVIGEIFFQENSSIRKKMKALLEQKDHLSGKMVGLDWVGNEIGYPYCVYVHSDFIEIIAEYQKVNPHFGVRLHAGEGLLRPATNEDFRSPVSIAFTLHMYILTASIRRYYAKMENALCGIKGKNLKPNIRIGHGIAFLHGHDVEGSTDPLHIHLAEFRSFLREKDIVSELNPTSNHLLLSDSCAQNSLGNNRTLKAFLKEKLPVTLCTDDDGIWAIHKCSQHYHHISVAYEYCQAIEHEDVTNEDDLRRMLDAGRKYAFCLPAKEKKRGKK